jgi:hypothetical protein
MKLIKVGTEFGWIVGAGVVITLEEEQEQEQEEQEQEETLKTWIIFRNIDVCLVAYVIASLLHYFITLTSNILQIF